MSDDISQDPGLAPSLRSPSASPQVTVASPASRNTEFVAVSGPAGESTSASAMLVMAYALFWVILVVFVWLTWLRQQRLAERLQQLETRLLQRQGEPK